MDEDEKKKRIEELGQSDLRQLQRDALKRLIEVSTARDGKDEDYTEAVEEALVLVEYADSVLQREADLAAG